MDDRARKELAWTDDEWAQLDILSSWRRIGGRAVGSECCAEFVGSCVGTISRQPRYRDSVERLAAETEA